MRLDLEGKTRYLHSMSAGQWVSKIKKVHPSWNYTYRLEKLLLLRGNRLDRSSKTICTSNYDQRGLYEVEHLRWDSVTCDDPVVISKDSHLK